MVAYVWGDYGAAFKGFRGLTQGDLLYPTIFNVVVDAVVCHWISLAEAGEGRQDGWVREVQHISAFFYANDRLVALTDPVWLQGAFDTLTGLFKRVGLRKNISNMVGMHCRNFRAAGTQSEAAHGQRMTGEGLTYRSRHRLRVKLPDCGVYTEAGLMAVHRYT